MVCTADGSRVYACDNDLSALYCFERSGAVEPLSVLPNGTTLNQPCAMVFDRCSLIPESVLYVTQSRALRRVTLAVGESFSCPHLTLFLTLLFLMSDAFRVMNACLVPSGCVAQGWLLPELWKVVAEYLTQRCKCSMFFLCTSVRLVLTHVLPLSSGEVTCVPTSQPQTIDPMGIAMTSSGVLLISCWETHSLYAVHPATGECERIAGTQAKGDSDGPGLYAAFHRPSGIVVLDALRVAVVCDQLNYSVRRVTLPPRLFQEQRLSRD
jgi:hypothetical protein